MQKWNRTKRETLLIDIYGITDVMAYSNKTIDGLTELKIDSETFNSGVYLVILTGNNSVKH